MKNLDEISLMIEEFKYLFQINDTKGIKDILMRNYNFVNDDNYEQYIKYTHYLVKHITLTEMLYRLLLLEIYDVDIDKERELYHDYSKFSNTEFLNYCEYFYGHNSNKDYFKKAWNSHQKFNKHHWQYWILIEDSGKIIPLEMDQKKVVEMIADWISAGYCITNKLDVFDWYKKNKKVIKLSNNTRIFLEESLTEIENNKDFYEEAIKEITTPMNHLFKEFKLD